MKSASHLQMPGSASTGAGLIMLVGTTKLATSINATRMPKRLGYLVFIIPPKFCKLRKLLFRDLRRNSTSPPPVLVPLNGESIHFFKGIYYSPPVRAAPHVPQLHFMCWGALCPGARTVSGLPRLALPALAFSHSHHLLQYIHSPTGKGYPLPWYYCTMPVKTPAGKLQLRNTLETPKN